MKNGINSNKNQLKYKKFKKIENKKKNESTNLKIVKIDIFRQMSEKSLPVTFTEPIKTSKSIWF